MQKKLTISMDSEVYEGLHRMIGRGRISRFLTELARPHVLPDALDAGYRALAADEADAREAHEWAEAMIGDVADDD